MKLIYLNKIAFICLGNICRSPLAEGLVRARAEEIGLELHLDSAGTGAWHIGQAPDPRAVAVAVRHGIDISGLRARQVQPGDFQRFDLLLCADRRNLEMLTRLRSDQGQARIALLLDWAGLEEGGEVPDPYLGDDSQFEAVFDLLSRAADAVVARLSGKQETAHSSE